MRRKRLGAVPLLLVIVIACWLTEPAEAQEEALTFQGMEQEEIVAVLNERLDLTEVQERQISTIVAEHLAKADSIRAKYTEGDETDRLYMLTELRRLWVDTDALIEAVLTEGQVGKYTRFKDERLRAARKVVGDEVRDGGVMDMVERLGLTEEQANEVIPILQYDFDKRRELFGEGGRRGRGDMRTMRSDMEAIDRLTERRLEPILTEEQMEGYIRIRDEQRKEMQEKMWQRMDGRRRGGRGGRGGF